MTQGRGGSGGEGGQVKPAKAKAGCWSGMMRCLGAGGKEEWTGASPPDYDSIFADPPRNAGTPPPPPAAAPASPADPSPPPVPHPGGDGHSQLLASGHGHQPGTAQRSAGPAALPSDPVDAVGSSLRGGAAAPATIAQFPPPAATGAGAIVVPGLQIGEGASGHDSPRPASETPWDPGFVFDIPDDAAPAAAQPPPAAPAHALPAPKSSPPMPPPRPAARGGPLGGKDVHHVGGLAKPPGGRLGGAMMMGGEGVSVSVSAALAVSVARPRQSRKAEAGAAVSPAGEHAAAVNSAPLGSVARHKAELERMGNGGGAGESRGSLIEGVQRMGDGRVLAEEKRQGLGQAATGTAAAGRAGQMGSDARGPSDGVQSAPDQPPPPSPTQSSLSDRAVDEARPDSASSKSEQWNGRIGASNDNNQPAVTGKVPIPAAAALPVIPKLLITAAVPSTSTNIPHHPSPHGPTHLSYTTPCLPPADCPLPEFPNLLEVPPPPSPPSRKPAADREQHQPVPSPPLISKASTSEMPKLALSQLTDKPTAALPVQPNRSKPPVLPPRESSPANKQSRLPASKTPLATPQHTPRMLEVARHTPSPLPAAEDFTDLTVVFDCEGNEVDCAAIEGLVTRLIPAVQNCMLVRHWTSSEVGCLITLPTTHGGAGNALEVSALQLAFKSGSEATTVISARQCARFRHGLSLQVQEANRRIPGRLVQIRRFQVLREDFTEANGLLSSKGEIARARVLKRYRHIIDDMYNHVPQQQQHKWMRHPSAQDANDSIFRKFANAPSPEDTDPAAGIGAGRSSPGHTPPSLVLSPRGGRGNGGEGLTPRRTSVESSTLDAPTQSPPHPGAKEPDTTTSVSLLGFKAPAGTEGGRSPRGAVGLMQRGQVSSSPQLTPRSAGGTPRTALSPRGGARAGADRSKGPNNKSVVVRPLPESSHLLPLVRAAGGGQTPRGAYSPACTVGAVTPFDRDSPVGMKASAEGLARSCMPVGIGEMNVGDEGADAKRSPRRASGGRKRGGEIGAGGGAASQARHRGAVVSEEAEDVPTSSTHLGERLSNGEWAF